MLLHVYSFRGRTFIAELAVDNGSLAAYDGDILWPNPETLKS